MINRQVQGGKNDEVCTGNMPSAADGVFAMTESKDDRASDELELS